MKICFIDDNLRMTYKVMEAMKNYYADQTQGGELECSMILIALSDVHEETLNYYKNIFDKLDISLELCQKLEDLEQIIKKVSNDAPLFMIDLYMDDTDAKNMKSDDAYKCVSMKCMDKLEEMELQYKWYSAYLESSFKDEWQKRYQKIYNRPIPKIYERNSLVQAYFKQELAKEILGV